MALKRTVSSSGEAAIKECNFLRSMQKNTSLLQMKYYNILLRKLMSVILLYVQVNRSTKIISIIECY